MNMINTDAKPFLKWAGGKGQLLLQLQKRFPQDLLEGNIKNYVEPFIGGGAVFFELNKTYKFEKVVLNDYNVELIMTYQTIRDQVDGLIKILQNMEHEFLEKDLADREKMFYKIREEFNHEKKIIDYSNVSEDIVSHSAKLIFLNKTCFNGLYRLNSKGAYNVPFGDNKNPTICDVENLKNVCEALQGVTLVHGDFEELTQHIDKDTFVYMDPPYRPLSGTSSFNNYAKAPFNDESQKRLACWFDELASKKGATLMLSNSDPKNSDSNDDFFDLLYKNYNIQRVSASRSINSKGTSRGVISELLITNYNSFITSETDESVTQKPTATRKNRRKTIVISEDSQINGRRKRIFISHPYQEDPKLNKKKVEAICKKMNESGYLPISPLHMFSYMKDDSARKDILEWCFDSICLCDEIWIYGESEGCILEKEHAEKNNKIVKVMY